jgi:hypothetical protein
MTMVCRCVPKESPEMALTEMEIQLLERLGGLEGKTATMGDYLLTIAKLGGYLARASDPPPGNMVMWRGISRLTDIHLGFLLAKEDVGN